MGLDGAVGDAAKAVGHVAVTCRTKCAELDEKHSISDKTSSAFSGCWEKTRELGEKHNVTEHAQNAANSAARGLQEANEKHQIVDKTAAGIAGAAKYLHKQMVASKLVLQ